jgi:hypothetical protein
MCCKTKNSCSETLRFNSDFSATSYVSHTSYLLLHNWLSQNLEALSNKYLLWLTNSVGQEFGNDWVNGSGLGSITRLWSRRQLELQPSEDAVSKTSPSHGVGKRCPFLPDSLNVLTYRQLVSSRRSDPRRRGKGENHDTFSAYSLKSIYHYFYIC